MNMLSEVQMHSKLIFESKLFVKKVTKVAKTQRSSKWIFFSVQIGIKFIADELVDTLFLPQLSNGGLACTFGKVFDRKF